VTVHGPVLRAADHVFAALDRLPVDEGVVQLARVEVFHDLSLFLVHQVAGEDQMRLVAAGPRQCLEARE